VYVWSPRKVGQLMYQFDATTMQSIIAVPCVHFIKQEHRQQVRFRQYSTGYSVGLERDILVRESA